MKRLILPAILVLATGCGGAQEASKSEASAAPAVAVKAQQGTPPAPVAMTEDVPKKSVKPVDEPPGLVLPDAEADAVGAKPPELPIR